MIFVLPAVVGLIFAWWLTRLLCSEKAVLSILDHPNGRGLHSKATPRTGGLAVIAGVVVSLGVTAAGYIVVQPPGSFLPKGLASGSLWIVVSMILVFVVSFVDDWMNLPASLRFGVQAAAAVIVIGGVGLTLSSIPIPGVGAIQLGWMAWPVSALFLMWMANLYNFMDGMDGFAGGMTVMGFGFLAYFGWEAEYPVMLGLGAMVAMSAMGFLVHNFPPARIFMGDAGSITLGFLGGTLMLLGFHDGIFEFWVPIILFSPFIVDATVTLLRRALRGEKIWHAHRDHYYQRLVLLGWGHKRTVIVEYGLMGLCGIFAVVYQYGTESSRATVLLTWFFLFVAFMVGVRWLEWLGYHRRQVLSAHDSRVGEGPEVSCQSGHGQE